MSYRVNIRRLAQAELAEAVAWYNLQGVGLGDQLLDSVDDTLAGIGENPNRWPQYYRTVRRAIVNRFPYLIYYEVHGDLIRVLRIVHAIRDPESLPDSFQ